jgi:tetratricopeptide (TPR) repeat protein|tara:strand:- start:675 stop:1646 length:972 start_codon:yes stop_codon:yes gene_type:complete
MKTTTAIIICLFFLISCIETNPSSGNRMIGDRNNKVVTSFEVDKELENKILSKTDRESAERVLLKVEKAFNENPENEFNIINYGIKLADLGRFQEAINLYDEGLIKFPESYKIRRYIGQHYLTTRQFDEAITSLSEAITYANDSLVIESEYSYLKSNNRKTIYNVKFNIWYYLGLSYYMKGNYDKAISSFRKCEKYTNNNDLKVVIANWLYTAFAKIGNLDLAEAEIMSIPTNMRLLEIKSRKYHDLIMLYRGLVTPSILTQRNGIDADVGYGIGNYYLINGQVENAISAFNRVISTEQQERIGYMAIEAELAVLLGSQVSDL